MIGNIKETLLPKTDMWKKQVLQDPRYAGCVKGACCMLHGTLQGCVNVKGVERNKTSIKNYI